jgi:S-adenosylhomocysteine hydrolase
MFPKLPLLETISARFGAGKPLANMRIVGIQHMLETTGSLVEALIHLGVAPGHVILAGKVYSSNGEVIDGLRRLGIQVIEPNGEWWWGELHSQLEASARDVWNALCRTGYSGDVVVLDDGGFTLAAASGHTDRYRVAGVEQTTSGTINASSVGLRCPTVDVAHSAAKKILESPLIEAAVLRRIHHLKGTFPRGLTWGVVGTGNVGTAILSGLKRDHQEVVAYDVEQSGDGAADVHFCCDLRQLFEKADMILGCAGQDILAGQTWWKTVSGEKILASCSSHDVEFRTLLRAHAEVRAGGSSDILGNVVIPTEAGRITMLRGGCPINFDGARESVPAEDIQITRALLLAGVLQAHSVLAQGGQEAPGFLPLAPEMQSVAALEWIRLRQSSYPNLASLAAIFTDLEQIAALSQMNGQAAVTATA